MTERQIPEIHSLIPATPTEVFIDAERGNSLGSCQKFAFPPPQVMLEKALESYYDYKRRLYEAASRERVNGVWPQWEVGFSSGYITTLIYSFDPSAVAFSLRELDAVEAGTKRTISQEAFWQFAGALGYPTLYQYLLQKKQNLLQRLLNLAVPATEIPDVYVLDYDAESWLRGYRLPFIKVDNTPLCHVIYNRSFDPCGVGREIIVYEKTIFLDFRQSLYIAASLLAPSLSEELDQQEQVLSSTQAVLYAVPQSSSDRRVRIVKETHDRALHKYHYFIEINDQANGISQPIKIDFVVDDEGTIIPPPEEEA